MRWTRKKVLVISLLFRTAFLIFICLSYCHHVSVFCSCYSICPFYFFEIGGEAVTFHDDLGGDDHNDELNSLLMNEESDVGGSEFSETPTEQKAETVEELAAMKNVDRCVSLIFSFSVFC